MLTFLRPALVMLASMTLLTGFAYPLAMTGLAQMLFPEQANGSRIVRDGTVIGSSLVAQAFEGEGYFHPRPSAVEYNGAGTGGSNLGPTSGDLIARVGAEADRLAAEGGGAPVPIDLVTTWASGLDPHVSPAAALFQAERVAGARQIPVSDIRDLVLSQVEQRTFGLLGEPRVNVLQLNLALDAMAPDPAVRDGGTPVAAEAPARQ
ncbi:potassium-transporting ATPase subunit KdpC [Aurantimonas endophytica]|uniref:Potassium-transporting ATPase KdpC subunit n=1 Tax=Aurantimonas endophytica TaxID=1522175 RepID=A0A7W6HA35_9HYPH|nr:K+-transporting ATPase ATPase C chain [Aurantimonas endophytica]MCO6402981.1 potassium-transporting ATPase subunit KdpC [Aurantimonas endophytica]